MEFDPEQLICHVLNSEAEVRKFARKNNIGNRDDHIFKVVIKSFKYLTDILNKRCSNVDQPQKEEIPEEPAEEVKVQVVKKYN